MRLLVVAVLAGACACGSEADPASPPPTDPPVNSPAKYRFNCTNTYSCSGVGGNFSVTGYPFPYCDVAGAPNALAAEKKWCEDNQLCHCQACGYGESCSSHCTATGATCN
jgi:hypothetical protein